MGQKARDPYAAALSGSRCSHFFDDDDISFRAHSCIPDKNQLDHEKYNQDHNTWYYKMYFEMLKVIFASKAKL